MLTVLRHGCRVPVDILHTGIMRRWYSCALAVDGQNTSLANHSPISHYPRLSLWTENLWQRFENGVIDFMKASPQSEDKLTPNLRPTNTSNETRYLPGCHFYFSSFVFHLLLTLLHFPHPISPPSKTTAQSPTPKLFPTLFLTFPLPTHPRMTSGIALDRRPTWARLPTAIAIISPKRSMSLTPLAAKSSSSRRARSQIFIYRFFSAGGPACLM